MQHSSASYNNISPQHHVSQSTQQRVLMEALVPRKNIKAFCAGMICLSKIGKDAVIECEHSGRITIRAMNDTHTAHATFSLLPHFFERYIFNPFHTLPSTGGIEDAHNQQMQQSYQSVVGKIQLKNCLSVFRSTKTIEHFSISFVQRGPTKHLVCFRTSSSKYGILKTYFFHYEQSPVYQASFDKLHSLHRIRTRPALFTEVLNHIHGTDEVTLTASPAGLNIQSYYSSTIVANESGSFITRNDLPSGLLLLTQNPMASGRKKKPAALLTEMHISAGDLDGFEFTLPGSTTRERPPLPNPDHAPDENQFSFGMTFGLREFKAVLQFCETNGVDVEDMALLFNNPGDPFLFTSNLSGNEVNEEDDAVKIERLTENGDVQESLVRPQSFFIELVMATIPPQQPNDPSNILSDDPILNMNQKNGGTLNASELDSSANEEFNKNSEINQEGYFKPKAGYSQNHSEYGLDDDRRSKVESFTNETPLRVKTPQSPSQSGSYVSSNRVIPETDLVQKNPKKRLRNLLNESESDLGQDDTQYHASKKKNPLAAESSSSSSSARERLEFVESGSHAEGDGGHSYSSYGSNAKNAKRSYSTPSQKQVVEEENEMEM